MAGNGNERDDVLAAPRRRKAAPWLKQPPKPGRLPTEPDVEDPNEQAPPPDVHFDRATRPPRGQND